jgi:glycosyltransferase involved in cell wall biosynthesis
MNISFLSTFYPFRGGIAQFNASLYRAFEKNHNVKAFTFTTQYPNMLFPGSSQFVGKEDSSADKIDSIRTLSTVNPLSFLPTANKIKREKPDLLIMKYWMPFFAPSLGSVSYLLKNKCKIITILDNVIPHEKRPGDITLNKFFLNQNHGFVAMSEVVKNDLLSLKPNAKYIFHPHPLYDHFGKKADQNEARKKLNLPTDKKIILFFGFIRDYKGLDLLINAMENMPNDYHLVIAGEVYGDFEKYKKLIDDKQLNDKITQHVRYISDNEVPLFFSAADVCALPYKSATQSGITSIAYHFDLPIIATDVGGLKESIEHNKTGLIVDSPDTTLIRNTIIDYFSNNKKDLFTSNISQLKKELSWDHLAQSILEFSKQL